MGELLICSIQLVFIGANIPIFVQRQFPPKSTCWITGLGLIGIGVGSALESLWFASASQALAGLVWLAMIFWRQRNG